MPEGIQNAGNRQKLCGGRQKVSVGRHKVWGAVTASIPLLPAQLVSGVLDLSMSRLIDLIKLI